MNTAEQRVYNVDKIRADFPILSQTMRGKPLAYLDSAATSLKPQAVIDSEIEYLTRISANIHRGVYELSERATVLYDESRDKIKHFIGAGSAGEAIFTKSATEASNIVARSWGQKFLKAGDEIVVTELEHHANIIPWQETASVTGAVLRFVPLGPGGEFDGEAVASVITDRTRVVAVTGMSNVTGFQPPIAEITRLGHDADAIVVIDGAQLASHAAVNMSEIGADFLTFSGHKMCGPTGVGVLYGRHERLEEMDPFLYGGDMIVRVYKDRATYKPAPDKFETGTPNISGVIALGAAVDYLESIGMESIHRHEEELVAYAHDRLPAVPGVSLVGPKDPDGRPLARGGGIVSFTFGEVHSHDVGAVLDSEGVAVRTGFHCAQPFMRFLGINGTVRASFYLYNRREDIDQLVAALGRVEELFG